MEKLHDNDEMEIDLIEILYALKKRALIILAALLAGALIAGVYTKLMITPSVQRYFDSTGHFQRDNAYLDRGPSVRKSADERLQHADHKPERSRGSAG